MNKKLLYLIRISLRKKLKTKSFLIVNIIFLILILALFNIDTIIKKFGGDFEDTKTIYLLDNTNYNLYDEFTNTFNKYNEIFKFNSIVEYTNDEKLIYDKLKEDDNNILLKIEKDSNNYFKSTLISNSNIDTTIFGSISTTLNTVKSNYAYDDLGINREDIKKIEQSVEIERIIIDPDAKNNSDMELLGTLVFPILLLPMFLLIMFLVQMIGAEINEEKSTKGMEIIISNVSAKTHFLSKLISSNLFVLLQAILLLCYTVIGSIFRLLISGGVDVNSLSNTLDIDLESIINNLPVFDNLPLVIVSTLILTILSFIGYSLIAAIAASMTTNMEDYQQVQTPIAMISLIGFYLSMMASLFKGSVLIRVLSYVPFISTMLSPVLFLTGNIGLIDVIISIIIMIITLYILIKYGLRIYRIGILNYSNTNIWKRMFKAVKTK